MLTGRVFAPLQIPGESRFFSEVFFIKCSTTYRYSVYKMIIVLLIRTAAVNTCKLEESSFCSPANKRWVAAVCRVFNRLRKVEEELSTSHPGDAQRHSAIEMCVLNTF